MLEKILNNLKSDIEYICYSDGENSYTNVDLYNYVSNIYAYLLRTNPEKKPVAVIGEGEYALKEASELANVTDDVTILTNGVEPTVDMSRFNVLKGKISEIKGDETVSSVVFESGEEVCVKGVFVALGVAGSTDIARKIGAFVSDGKITVDDMLATSVPGLFAAGDCIGGTLQIYKAVRDGAVAARSAIKFVKK